MNTFRIYKYLNNNKLIKPNSIDMSNTCTLDNIGEKRQEVWEYRELIIIIEGHIVHVHDNGCAKRSNDSINNYAK